MEALTQQVPPGEESSHGAQRDRLVSQGQTLPPSLWAATANPAIPTPPLEGSCDVDVAIVGAGYTGLSTALHLAGQGVRVCVLDAAEPGWGASGRNGGQVIPGLKYDPEGLLGMYGAERGELLVSTVGSAADNVFALIKKHGIECDAVRAGWIQPAHSTAVLGTLARRASQWEARGARVGLLSKQEVERRVGTSAYVGGWVDYRAGSIQPLSYARGLAHAASRLGAAIHGRTLVTELREAGRKWRLKTSQGATVTADEVVIATNGYTDGLWPGLRETVIAANSFIVATRPLTPEQARSVLPGGEIGSDSRRLLLYFRKDADNRLLLGGRGPFSDPRSVDDWRHLERSVELLFPQLGKPEYEFRWAGRIALTRDFLPHVHRPKRGLTIALGYNGRGIAMATTMGMHLAGLLAAPDRSQFPFPVSEVRAIPFHQLQRFYIAAGVAWYSLLDKIS